MHEPEPTPEEIARMDRIMLRSALGFRVFQLAEAACRVIAERQRLERPKITALGLGLAAGELCWFTRRVTRAGSMRDSKVLTADVAFVTALHSVSAAGAGSAELGGRLHWTAAYAQSAVMSASVGAPTLPHAMAAAATVALGYYASLLPAARRGVSGDHGGGLLGTAVFNSLMYAGFSVPQWFISRRMFRSADELRATRDNAVDRVRETARQRERLRHHRLVHDSAIQTLEALAAFDPIDESAREAVRRQAQQEAARLRRVLDGTENVPAPDVDDAFAGLVERFAGEGLRVELVLETLDGDPSSEIVAALHDATRRALIHAHRHESCTKAVVRVLPDDGRLHVSVRGRVARGADATAINHDGLRQSLTDRLAPVSGSAIVRAASGGPRIDMWIPLTEATRRPTST